MESDGRCGRAAGGTIIITGVTTGLEVTLSLLPVLAGQITVCGSIMGTLEDMQNLINFIVAAGIKPEIGQVLPMECAERIGVSQDRAATNCGIK